MPTTLDDATLNALWMNNGVPPEKIFLVRPEGETISYGTMYAMADRFAATFETLGLRSGDRIATVLDKSHFAIGLYMACVRYGFVYCPMNATSTPRELDFLIGHVNPSLVLCRGDLEDALRRIVPSVAVMAFEADGGGSFFACSRQAGSMITTGIQPGPDDPAAIMYTSGTTGRPKAALMSQRNLATNATALREAWQFRSDDVLMHALPIHHTHGLFVALNVVLAAGASVVFLPRFDAEQIAALLRNCTVMMGVPTHYTRLLRHPAFDRRAAADIRLFVSGSAPLPVPVNEEIERRTGHRVMERYGMTEVGIISSNRLSEPPCRGTVGVPLNGVEVRLTPTAETGVGRVEVRGPGVFHGYWSSEGRDKSDFTADGYFVTGDLGKFDDFGHLVLVGREKDVIITGGLNVYPKEVEQEIRVIDGVDDVAVAGVTHPDFGEAVVAFVVMQPDSALDELAISRSLRESLAGYKQPKKIVFVDELPRNSMGKVDVKLLRTQYADLFVDA